MAINYRGDVSRSLLEARWAFLMDLLGIDWQKTDGWPVWLTDSALAPTFYLPSRNTWLLVDDRADIPALRAVEKFDEDVEASYRNDDHPNDAGDPGSLMPGGGGVGQPRHDDVLLIAATGIPDPTKIQRGSSYDNYGSMWMLGNGTSDSPYLWTRCPQCGYIDAQFCGRAERLQCGHGDEFDKDYRSDDPIILAAYARARAATRARYSARCVCGEPIGAGQLIVPYRKVWRHAECWLRNR